MPYLAHRRPPTHPALRLGLFILTMSMLLTGGVASAGALLFYGGR